MSQPIQPPIRREYGYIGKRRWFRTWVKAHGWFWGLVVVAVIYSLYLIREAG